MKKLMIAFAATVVAVAAQAASVSWAAGTLYTPASSDGGWSTTKAGASVSGSLYLLAVGDADTAGSFAWFNAQYAANGDMSAVYDYFTTGAGKETAASKTGTSASRTSALTMTTDGEVGSTYYAAVIYTTSDANGDYYIANIGSVTLESDAGVSLGNLATAYLSGTSTASIGGWTAVPEPTSGLLMLLGMAGLALKRKRA